MSGRDTGGIEAIGALADGVRRALYDIVVDADHPVGRDEAAAAVGVARQTAAYHLDRLADEGLLEVSYERLSGRTGPGAGRPAKLYQRSDVEHDVTLPPRRYLLAARILLEAVAGEGGDDEELDRLTGAARRTGEGLAKGGLDEALRANGYEPVERGGEVRFRNCPFHALVAEDRQTTCALNHALVEGMIAGSGDDRAAVLEPEEGYCCVRIRSG
jgi:predicted ArsR family transcriptional regulator